MPSSGQYQCPCCDFYTLANRASYDICPVCYWEDEGLDLDRLDQPSRANHISLRQARSNFVQYGACDEGAVSLVMRASERAGLRREVRATMH